MPEAFRVSTTAKKTDPELWEKVKQETTEGGKGGKPGQWSARKAQMAAQEYKKEGGGYAGPKTADNHLSEWTRENWGTKSGHASEETGERYLPKKARERLTDEEYRRTTTKKRTDTARGKQFSAQPADVADKAASARSGTTKAELMAQAKGKGIAGRSRMTKDALVKALGNAP